MTLIGWGLEEELSDQKALETWGQYLAFSPSTLGAFSISNAAFWAGLVTTLKPCSGSLHGSEASSGPFPLRDDNRHVPQAEVRQFSRPVAATARWSGARSLFSGWIPGLPAVASLFCALKKLPQPPCEGDLPRHPSAQALRGHISWEAPGTHVTGRQ